MRRGRLLIGLLVLFLVAVLVASVATIFHLLGEGSPSRGGGQALVVSVSGPLPEQPMPDEPIAAFGRNLTSVLEIDAGLRRAANDDNIEHLLIRPAPLLVGYGKLQELRDAIQRFKADSGKPVTCWMETAGNKEYYLATACDRIYMAPEGFFLVNGLHLSVTFYKGTLDKLGVEAEFARAGKYKSAIEPMVSTEMSAPFREMMEELATSLYGDFVEAISQSRGLPEETIKALIDDPPLTAAGAARAGLIDGLIYEDQLDDLLAGGAFKSRPVARYDTSWIHDGPPMHIGKRNADPSKVETVSVSASAEESPEAEDAPESDSQEDRPPDPDASLEAENTAQDTTEVPESEVAETSTEAAREGEAKASAEEQSGETEGEGEDVVPLETIKLGAYLAETGSRTTGKPKIAIIFCEGTIVSGKSESGGGMGGSQMGSDTIAAAIKSARENDRIEAVVLRVDSPGGSGLASDIIWREIELTRFLKPVVVSMSDYAASGGYYISMNADAIVAQPGTLTGSIGVYAGKYNLAGLYEKVGLRTESIERGDFSDLFAPNKPLGEDGRAKLSEFIDEFYGGFITKAAEGRGVEPGAIHAVAQGRVWTGRQAYDLGLVDELGSLRTAIAIAKEKAGIEGSTSLTLLPRRPTFLEELLGTGPQVSALSVLLDTSIGSNSAQLQEAARHMLAGLELFADGTPVLLAPFHVQPN